MDKPKKSIGIADLGDVDFTLPLTNGEVVKYDSGAGKWVNGVDAGGVTTFAALTDTDIGNLNPLQNNNIVKYNSTLGKWYNSTILNEVQLYDINCTFTSPTVTDRQAVFNLDNLGPATLATMRLPDDQGTGDIEILGTTNSQDVQNKNMKDSNNRYYSFLDPTAQMSFDLGAVTTGTTAQLQVPDASGLLVLEDSTSILSNKTMETGTNYRDASFSFDITTPTTPSADIFMTEKATQKIFNKSFYDTSTYIVNFPDNTRRANLSCASIPTMTDRIYEFPDASGEFTLTAATQTMLNKTMTSNTNNVISRELWVGSGAGSVSTYAATAPTTGQHLVATSATTATWQTLATPKKQRNYMMIIKDACSNNETNYSPAMADISPGEFGNIYFGTAYKLIQYTATIIHNSSQTISAGTMTFDVGTVAPPYIGANYTNVLTIGTLTSGTNPVFNASGLSQAFGATDRIVFRQTTDGAFSVNNTNSDVLIEAVFEEV